MNAHEALRQFAREVGGEFVEGGLFSPSKVKVVTTVKEWTITLELRAIGGGPHADSTNYGTRITAPYRTQDRFRFDLYRRGFFDDVRKRFFRMQDIEIGYSDFDRDFIIKSNDKAQVRALFADERIRQSIQAEADIKLKVQPYAWCRLWLEVPEEIYSVSRLKALHQLFVQTLEKLARMGSAS